MEKLLGTLKSRTTWTIAAMFVMNNLVDIKAILPAGWGSYLNLALAFAAIYFRANPIQTMGVPTMVATMVNMVPTENSRHVHHTHGDAQAAGCCGGTQPNCCTPKPSDDPSMIQWYDRQGGGWRG